MHSLERVIAAYHALPGAARELRRDRVAVHYRAFLSYLMAEALDGAQVYLRTLLHEHMRYLRCHVWRTAIGTAERNAIPGPAGDLR